MNKHEFALFCPQEVFDIASCAIDQTIILNDQLLMHRLLHVLRLTVADTIVLFNQQEHLVVTIVAIAKKLIHAKIIAKASNKTHMPHITFLLPLLKREAVEQAVYSLTEIGVNEIQLVTTQKIQRTWHGAKEMQRLRNIIIAAAEQSKNFAYPNIENPLSFQEAIEKKHSENVLKLFGDPSGKKIATYWQSFQQAQSYILTIGPEGDFTHEEKKLLEQQYFFPIVLAPTILRAQQAATLLAGIIRLI